MEAARHIKAFLQASFTKTSQLIPKTSTVATPPTAQPAVADQQNLDWAMIMIGISLPLAVEIAIQSLQSNNQAHLPTTFHLLCLAIIFSFTFLFLGKLITMGSSKFPVTALVLQGLGVLFAVTATFVAITIPLPLELKWITWILYVVFLIAVIIISVICNRI